MKRLSILAFVLLFSSCLSHKPDEPIIVPPNFAEMPDLKNPEKPTQEEKDENLSRLKELLLKSD